MNVYFRSNPVVLVCALMAFALSCPAWANIIIDDYGVGGATLPAPVRETTVRSTQSALDTSRVAGGVRHMELFSYGDNASVVVDHGDLAMTCRSTSYVTITYNGNPGGAGHSNQLNLDLSNMDRFELTFNYTEHHVTVLIVRVNSGFTYSSHYLEIRGEGTYQAPFAGFSTPVNWSDIDMVRLEFSVYGSSPHTEKLTDFRAVPEPSALALLLITAGLTLRRRR